ncbi:MAG: DUF3037 domain-containing protein [Thiohalomonadales bacterium]
MGTTVNKIACQYAIVRFAPFVETGEFANVGIVMMAPKHRFFDFQLEIKRHGRITNFFDKFDPKVYRATLYNLRDELDRAANMLKQHGFDKRLKANDINFATGLFKEIIRPRETIIRFDNMRTVLAGDPKETLKELFGYYVERNFVTKEYQETVLEKGVRKLLYDQKMSDRFVKAIVGNDEYHTNFPFVERRNEHPVKIIKPLHLAHEEPSKILDHGGAWLFRINQLKKLGLLPSKVLFTISGPDADGNRCKAYKDIESGLLETGVGVAAYSEKQKIVDFASL